MTSLPPRPAATGEPGFDFVEWGYPAVDVGVRFGMWTATYPHQNALSPDERAMTAWVATDMWRRTIMFDDPVISALEGQHAAVHGCCPAMIDHVGSTALRIPNAGTEPWREAISTALLSDWAHLIGGDSASLMVPRHLKREAKRAHAQNQPLWERRPNGRRVQLLDKPVADGLTLQDLVPDDSEPDQDLLETTIDGRLEPVLGKLNPDQRDVVLAWVRDRSVRTWADAARSAGASRPDEFGEQVRQRVKRIVAREGAASAAQGGDA